jgi:hypothetical protein
LFLVVVVIREVYYQREKGERRAVGQDGLDGGEPHSAHERKGEDDTI